ncbi:hypothetical protein A2U01_0011621 [Trifolium medium]|uniref:Uncharacterized protein n=1 Tax=Trifolium medium TaxID=97028 RepID=A0A392MUR9_9FABA|nr:hypothetical protein [Trifolium medium]
MRCGPQLLSLMYDSVRTPSFPFYWTENPRAIKGFHDAHLTPFERRTIAFLDTFCRLDTKELLRRETNVDSIVVYLKRMRTVSEEDWLSYLTISSQQKSDPDALVTPELQLVIVDLEAVGSQPSSPQAKGGRSLRSRTTIPVKPAGEDISTQGGVSGAPKDNTVKDASGNATTGTEAIKDASPVASTTDGEDKSSAWDKSSIPLLLWSALCC